MTTQATIIINFHDDPEFCHDLGTGESCNYFCYGRCVLRVVDPKATGIDKFLKLDKFYKDPSCKFIWEKSKKDNK